MATWTCRGRVSVERLGVEAEVVSPAITSAHTPPTLILHGTKDTTVPYASVVAFERMMKKEGRQCKLVGYDGEVMASLNARREFRQTLEEADAFLVDLGWIHSHGTERK